MLPPAPSCRDTTPKSSSISTSCSTPICSNSCCSQLGSCLHDLIPVPVWECEDIVSTNCIIGTCIACGRVSKSATKLAWGPASWLRAICWNTGAVPCTQLSCSSGDRGMSARPRGPRGASPGLQHMSHGSEAQALREARGWQTRNNLWRCLQNLCTCCPAGVFVPAAGVPGPAAWPDASCQPEIPDCRDHSLVLSQHRAPHEQAWFAAATSAWPPPAALHEQMSLQTYRRS